VRRQGVFSWDVDIGDGSGGGLFLREETRAETGVGQ